MTENKWLEEYYGGDLDRCFEENRQYWENEFRNQLRWEDIQLAATILPQYEELGRKIIKDHLGYLPPECVTIAFEPELRAIVHQYYSGVTTVEQLRAEADSYIKLIRNYDVNPHKYSYTPALYEAYHAQWLPYGQQTRARLTHFLGYEPHLENSIYAEMYIRGLMAVQDYNLGDQINSADMEAITWIKFREVLRKDGIDAALESSLYGIEFGN